MRRADRVRAVAAENARRALVVLLAQHARESQHLLAIRGERVAILVRQRAGLQLAALEHEMVACGGQRHGAQIRTRRLQPVGREIQFVADLRVQQIGQVRAGGDAEPRRELASDRGAPDAVGRFEDGDLLPGFRQIGGADQAVVAGADDDDAVAVSHPATLGERARDDADPSGFRVPRSHLARPSRRRRDACRSRTCRSLSSGRDTGRSQGRAG